MQSTASRACRSARSKSGVALSTLAVAASCLRRPSWSRAMALVAAAGLLHGLVHGTESGAANVPEALPFIVGMMVSTLMLHLTGASIGRLLQARWLALRLAPSFLGGSLLMPQPAMAQDAAAGELDAIKVMGNYDNAVGTSDAASAGRVTSNLLSTRPPLRPAEILEYVPGLIVTQHSGDGKANQYFLRGFNLDHGTDFATYVDGMPVNMPTHAHGHGYTDLNFLLPEVVDTIDYAKGPYRAASGDFASAGSASIGLKNRLQPTGTLTIGRERLSAHLRRLLAAGSGGGGHRRTALAADRPGGATLRWSVGGAPGSSALQRAHPAVGRNATRRLVRHGDGLRRTLDRDRPGARNAPSTAA